MQGVEVQLRAGRGTCKDALGLPECLGFLFACLCHPLPARYLLATYFNACVLKRLCTAATFYIHVHIQVTMLYAYNAGLACDERLMRPKLPACLLTCTMTQVEVLAETKQGRVKSC